METNKIYLGNAYELIKQIPDKSIDLVVTDPPYNISVSHGSGAFGVDKKISFKQIENISLGFDKAILDEFCRVLKKINIYIWCSQKQIKTLLDYFVDDKNCYFNIISWHKTNPVPTINNKYLPDTEFCLFFREKGVPLLGSYDSKRTFYVSQINKKDKILYEHPTPKPLEIIKNFIINSSDPEDLIFDPFLGSGTTAVACKQLKRNYIGFEIEPKYYESSLQRLENKQLKLLESGLR